METMGTQTREAEPQELERELAERYKYPPALAKACWDAFEYGVRLRTGEIFQFTEAKPIDENWVELRGIEKCKTELEFILERGMQVRVADIVWVADAPNGS